MNSNAGVDIVAEPLSRIRNSHGAADELAAIQSQVYLWENDSNQALGRDWAVSGFNEKLLSKRYGLPTDPVYFDRFRQFLLEKKFR